MSVPMGLKIDWSTMPTYNTIMSVAAGAALIALVVLGKDLIRARTAGVAGSEPLQTDGWAVALGVLGLVLFPTGLHMTLTWPLAKGGFPFDNVIFGETSLGLSALLLGAAFYLWKRGTLVREAADPVAEAARVARPISWFVGGLGLSLFGIAAAGITYQLFAAPPQEPISGAFAQWPWLEATFMSLLFALVGLGAVLFPFAVRQLRAGYRHQGIVRWIGAAWMIAGIVFLLFGAMNFFTHIGLIVNTM
ncbi:DUF981 family protein [Sinomonas soli]